MEQIRTRRVEAMEWIVDMISGDHLDEATSRWLRNMEMESAIQANAETMEAAAVMKARDQIDIGVVGRSSRYVPW